MRAIKRSHVWVVLESGSQRRVPWGKPQFENNWYEIWKQHNRNSRPMIFVSLALNQTPVHTARPHTRRWCIARGVPTIDARLPTQGWPGWVDLGNGYRRQAV